MPRTTPRKRTSAPSPNDRATVLTNRNSGLEALARALQGKLLYPITAALVSFIAAIVAAALLLPLTSLGVVFALAVGGIALCGAIAVTVVRARNERARAIDQLSDSMRGLLRSNLARVSGSVMTVEEDLHQVRTAAEATQALLETCRADIDRLSREVSSVYEGNAELRQLVEDSKEALTEDLKRQVSSLDQRIQDSLGREPSYATNADHYQPFSRTISQKDLAVIEREWAPRLGLRFDHREVAYLAHTIAALEERGLGRMAASIENLVLRALTARAALKNASEPPPELRVLEIGTLFGLGLGALYEACRASETRVHVTAVDPLDGYYGDGRPDPVTGVPVNVAVFEENMRRSRIPTDRWALLEGRSIDALPTLKDDGSRFGLIVIDADHTRTGVETDFELAAPLLEPGGFLIFDDYGSKDWPDISEFVDQVVMYRNEFQLVGSGFNAVVFRLVRR